MKIVADKDIPLVEEYFSSLGDVRLKDGRSIFPEDLIDADALIVRTVTHVNKNLIENSTLSFVASATAGIDHINQQELSQRNIRFDFAPGCNARAVAEYVLSALFILSEQFDFALADKTVGIIGCGNVGSQARNFLNALGITCLVNDPPLKDSGQDKDFCELDELLQADIITLHTPLIEQGPYQTRDLVNQEFLGKLKPGALLINTSRGQVLNDQDLLSHMSSDPDFKLVIDVWNHEPNINQELLLKAAISTPHIAGYTLDAKARATHMVYKAACNHFGQPDHNIGYLDQNDIEPETKLILAEQESDMGFVHLAVQTCYDVRSDSASLRREFELNDAMRPRFFDELRRTAQQRREFPSMTVAIPANHASVRDTLMSLGFKTTFY